METNNNVSLTSRSRFEFDQKQKYTHMTTMTTMTSATDKKETQANKAKTNKGSEQNTNRNRFLGEIELCPQPHCDLSFKLKLNLHRHLYKDHGMGPIADRLAANKTFQCTQCSDSFTTSSLLEFHQNSHRGMHKCPQCSKTFPHKAFLEAHVRLKGVHRTQDRSGVWPCLSCDKTFSHKSTLVAHEIKVHGKRTTLPLVTKRPNPDEEIKCSECDKVFQTATLMRKHMIAHSDERPFPCEVCGKAYKYKVDLKAHLYVHEGKGTTRNTTVKIWECQQCDTTFGRQDGLRAHQLRHHTVERRFKCDKCDRAFVTAQERNVHQNTHGREGKPNTCSRCKQAFTLRGLKERREAAEQSGKPHCGLCGTFLEEENN